MSTNDDDRQGQQQLALPVASAPRRPPRPTSGVTLAEVDPVAAVLERFPELPLIVAHMGMGEYSDFLDLAERYENVYLDTTMAFTDFVEETTPFPPAERARLADLGHKVLLGTDFPNIPYPYAHQIEVLDRLGLGDDWMRAVLWHNGAELFRITA